jgi:inhibitor of cysteine peptidase
VGSDHGDPSPAKGETGPVKTLDAAADHGRIQLALGESFQLRLDENPTTGYAWRTDGAGAPALELDGDTYEAPASVPGLTRVGTPGFHVWRFRAVGLGAVAIELSYRRPGRGGASARTFSLAVEIR